jgi:hypothetical protein
MYIFQANQGRLKTTYRSTTPFLPGLSSSELPLSFGHRKTASSFKRTANGADILQLLRIWILTAFLQTVDHEENVFEDIKRTFKKVFVSIFRALAPTQSTPRSL